MQRNRYSTQFKEQALNKARQRGSRTLESVATELNLSLGSLKLAQSFKSKSFGFSDLGDLAQRHCGPTLELWATPAGASRKPRPDSGVALNAWCREKGLFEHQVCPESPPRHTGTEQPDTASLTLQLRPRHECKQNARQRPATQGQRVRLHHARRFSCHGVVGHPQRGNHPDQQQGQPMTRFRPEQGGLRAPVPSPHVVAIP
jgi:transposase-like protein